MKRERKRLLAALLAFALTFVTIMSDVQIVKAKGPTIVKIYGTLSEWGDPQNLEIADEAPQGKILIAKMVSDGKYNLVDGDLDIALVLNNAETTIERETGVTYIPEKWQMAGNSCISFDGMEITSSDGNFPAFPSEDMNDVNEILAFFQKYPYADEMDFMTGEIIDPMIPYDVTITGDYTLNDVWANTFTVAEGAEFTLAPMYRQTGFDPSTGTRTYDTLSSGGILDGNRFVINGKFITLEGDRIENHPNLALYENGSLIVGENASFDLAEGTELILSDYVTCSGVTLYQYVDEEDAYGNVYPVLQSFEMDDKHGR